MSEATFTVPERNLLQQLGIATAMFRKLRAGFRAGADFRKSPGGILWTEAAAEKLREAVLAEKPAAALPGVPAAIEAELTVAYVPPAGRNRVFAVGAGGDPKDRTCWLPVAVRSDRTGLFLRGMKLRAAKTADDPVWKLLGAPGEARLRYPRRRGVW